MMVFPTKLLSPSPPSSPTTNSMRMMTTDLPMHTQPSHSNTRTLAPSPAYYYYIYLPCSACNLFSSFFFLPYSVPSLSCLLWLWVDRLALSPDTDSPWTQSRGESPVIELVGLVNSRVTPLHCPVLLCMPSCLRRAELVSARLNSAN
jgi:hypothetical protein